MTILLLGSGGREHALAWKMLQSSKCTSLFVAPGNAGTAEIAKNIALNPNDFAAVKTFVLEEKSGNGCHRSRRSISFRNL